MATTTDELLEAAESEEEISEINYLVIDNDLRTITIPSGEELLGVESDEEVRRVYFKMPATYGEFDLSEFVIRVNYLNANSEGDLYAVEDAESDGEYITFSWLVGRNATAYKGTVYFIVCLKLLDTSGDDTEVTKEFNTTLAKLTVLEGLETGNAIVQSHEDLVETLLQSLQESVAATAAAINATEATEEAIATANTAASNADTATANANIATTNANTATTNANTATANAEAATTAAEEATEAANEAAESANTAAAAVYTDRNFLLLLNDDGSLTLTYNDSSTDETE